MRSHVTTAILFILMIMASCGLYLWTTQTEYNVPRDPIYLTIGPTEIHPGSISVSYFRFIAYLDENRVRVYGYLYFTNRERTHSISFYLPFKVIHVSNNTYTNVKPKVYCDLVDGSCSLIRFDMGEPDRSSYDFDFNITVTKLWSTRKMGEKTVTFAFGPPTSARFISVMQHIERPSIEIARLDAVSVTVAAGKDYWFSSDTYPTPDAEYLTDVSRYATWLLDFRGRLGDHYRSIHCSVRDPNSMQLKDFLLLVYGLVIGSGIAFLTDFVTGKFRICSQTQINDNRPQKDRESGDSSIRTETEFFPQFVNPIRSFSRKLPFTRWATLVGILGAVAIASFAVYLPGQAALFGALAAFFAATASTALFKAHETEVDLLNHRKRIAGPLIYRAQALVEGVERTEFEKRFASFKQLQESEEFGFLGNEIQGTYLDCIDLAEEHYKALKGELKADVIPNDFGITAENVDLKKITLAPLWRVVNLLVGECRREARVSRPLRTLRVGEIRTKKIGPLILYRKKKEQSAD